MRFVYVKHKWCVRIVKGSGLSPVCRNRFPPEGLENSPVTICRGSSLRGVPQTLLENGRYGDGS